MSVVKAIFMGGLLVPFFIGTTLAYDQQNTHPALTGQAVDFYNLNFPDNPITSEEKELMIKGAIEEDTGIRPMNHFYDPVYDEGWLGYRSSKVWAMSSSAQQERKNLYAVSGFLADKTSDDDPADFSYERALLDYARGNKKRAFEAFGHVLHLLEDANVPEHTRNDTHLPINHTTGSPYETAMAKWNSDTFKVADDLYKKKQKPILFSGLNEYFDAIATYSNNFFFSEDTIFFDKYNAPTVSFWKAEYIDRQSVLVGYKVDELGQYRLLKILDKPMMRNIAEGKSFSVNDSLILDGYWERLSKDFVLHGAGAIKMFLEQGEEVKKRYEEKMALEKNSPEGWFKKLFGALLSGGASGEGIAFVQETLPQIESESATLAEILQETTSLDPTPSISPEPAPSTSATPTTSPTGSVSQAPSPSTTPELSPVSLRYSSGGGYGGGTGVVNQPEVSDTPEPLPEPTPEMTLEFTPTPTPLPAITPMPEASPSPASTPIAELASASPILLISEIQVAGIDAGDEFVELYNPGESELLIENWSIQYVAGTASTSKNVAKKNFGAGQKVAVQSFFLMARGKNSQGGDGYSGEQTPDLLQRSFSLSGTANGGKVFVVNNQEEITDFDDPDIVDKVDYAFAVPEAGQSMERKAKVEEWCVSPQEDNELQGNGCDSGGDADDFVIRTEPNPQNSQSLPEPRADERKTESSFLKQVDFYATRNSPLQYWLRLEWDSYPFIPTILKHLASGQLVAHNWQAIIFYYNQPAPETADLFWLTLPGSAYQGWGSVAPGGLKVKYPNCYGDGFNTTASVLILPYTAQQCSALAGNFASFAIDWGLLASGSLNLGVPWSNFSGLASPSESDFVSLAFYAYQPGYEPNNYGLRFLSADNNKYYFKPEK